MLSKRALLLSRRVVLLGLLAGCGLAPVYGTNGQASVLRNAVTFTAPDTVAGFRLREQLERRLGRATTAQFDLTVTLSQKRRPATITPDGDTTRFNLVGAADWALSDADKVIASGTVDSFTSYSATGSTVATQAAATDATARLSVALADMIVARLILIAPDFPQ